MNGVFEPGGLWELWKPDFHWFCLKQHLKPDIEPKIKDFTILLNIILEW